MLGFGFAVLGFGIWILDLGFLLEAPGGPGGLCKPLMSQSLDALEGGSEDLEGGDLETPQTWRPLKTGGPIEKFS